MTLSAKQVDGTDLLHLLDPTYHLQLRWWRKNQKLSLAHQGQELCYEASPTDTLSPNWKIRGLGDAKRAPTGDKQMQPPKKLSRPLKNELSFTISADIPIQ